jgi:hypothetical protein
VIYNLVSKQWCKTRIFRLFLAVCNFSQSDWYATEVLLISKYVLSYTIFCECWYIRFHPVAVPESYTSISDSVKNFKYILDAYFCLSGMFLHLLMHLHCQCGVVTTFISAGANNNAWKESFAWLLLQNHFIRHNTPHPRELRGRHNRLFTKPNSNPLSSNDTTKEVVWSEALDSNFLVFCH